MWMRIDDGLPTHRKTRAVLKSHADKTRDAAPLGIWALAGAYAGKHGTDGWVPEDELDRWDDDWQPLVDRLIRAGFWWPYERDGEPGYGFNDWHDYNDPAGAASKAGSFGNHVRWHVNEGKVDPTCEHCPKEPDEPEEPESYRGAIGGRSGGDIAPDSGGESHFPSGAIALPLPEPLPEPDPNPNTSSCASAHAERDTSSLDADFANWYAAYPRKRGKGQAAKAYKAARKKTDAHTLLVAIHAQADALTANGNEFCPYPATWLNGERWNDIPDAPPLTNTQRHMQLVRQLAAEEAQQTLEIGDGR